MSGGFNFGQASTGFSFGAQKTTSAITGTSFGMTSSTPAASGGGFSFGAAAQPASNPTDFGQASTGFSFGAQKTTSAITASGGGFSFGAPLTQPLTQPPTQPLTQPLTQPAAAATATTASGGSFGGFNFGATKVQVTTAAAPTVVSGGGFTFGTSAPSNLTLGSQSQPASTAASTAAQGGGLAFGIKPSSTPAPPASTASGPSLFAASAPAAASTTAASTGFTLGALVVCLLCSNLWALSAATTAAAPTGVSTGFALGIKPASGMTATAAATVTTIPTAATAPPVMTYAQLEGLINKWSLELEDQERHFLQQATQVNAWDRMLVENGEKITALHKEMEKVKLDQRRLNQELDFILSQQKELEDLLCPLEESVKEQTGTIYMQNADEERERTYKLAENVDAQLKRMSQDLKEIIEHLNTSSGPADSSDPLQQICKILNTHMDSLQWIDQNSVLLQRRVEEVSKLCDNQRKEQEKTFRLTFD
uniref:Nuclear pore glycoprotein p62 n=1 Tax=Mola mola TaxID=94237 RepID=A0A3Q3VN25_MOLML